MDDAADVGAKKGVEFHAFDRESFEKVANSCNVANVVGRYIAKVMCWAVANIPRAKGCDRAPARWKPPTAASERVGRLKHDV